jgi:hypothetical protein
MIYHCDELPRRRERPDPTQRQRNLLRDSALLQTRGEASRWRIEHRYRCPGESVQAVAVAKVFAADGVAGRLISVGFRELVGDFAGGVGA